MKWNDRIGRRLTLNDLHVFMTVAEAGSMVKAAEQLALSQSSVSKAIANLEHTIGVHLFDRTARGVDITGHGRALLRRSTAAFAELREVINDIEVLAASSAGEIRVGCPEAIASGLLVPALTRLAEEHPTVIVRIFPANNLEREFQLLRYGAVDFLLGGIQKSLIEHDLHAEVLYEDRPFIVAGVNHRWARRRRVELAEVVDEPWLLAPESIFRSSIAATFESKGLPVPTLGVRSYSIYQRLTLLATGRFVGAESGSVLRYGSDRFPFKILPVEFSPQCFSVAILTLKNRTMASAVHTFIGYVREVAQAMEE
jgi:DNA-binding transcriptional LysR family regulator